MSDAQNLNDFFAQNSKKKKNVKKPAANKANKAAAAVDSQEEEVKEVTTPAVQPETQQPAEQDFADSSDDESNQIVLQEGRQKVIDIKDVEASKKHKEDDSSDAVAGWGLGSKFGKAAEQSATSQPSFASAAKPQTGGNMSFGKPTFQRKSKGIMDTQDFPDIGDAATVAAGATPAETGGSKANRPMMFSGGAAARGPRVEGEAFSAFPAHDEEIKTAKTKPVFRGKAKFNTGGASNEEVNNSRMNYDFSKMNMSAATSKVAGAPGEEGEARQGGERDGERRGGQRGARDVNAPMFGDEDFEVVTEKVNKPREPRREFEEPTFGGGKPMFTRGGDNRK